MKTINQEEPVTRSRFIDCPSCKTHTLRLKKVIQSGRCKSCHESYKIVIVYVKDDKKPKSSTSQPADIAPESTLPSWQIPSDSSLFGALPSDSNSIFTDTNSTFGEDDKGRESPSSGE